MRKVAITPYRASAEQYKETPVQRRLPLPRGPMDSCPACRYLSKPGDVMFRFCRGGWFKRCPREPHLDHSCPRCGATWLTDVARPEDFR